MSKQKLVKQLLVSKSEAAVMLGVSEMTVVRLALQGAIPVVKLPSTGKVGRPRNMFAVADLERFIEELRTFDNDTETTQTVRPRRTRSRHHSAKEAIRELSVSK